MIKWEVKYLILISICLCAILVPVVSQAPDITAPDQVPESVVQEPASEAVASNQSQLSSLFNETQSVSSNQSPSVSPDTSTSNPSAFLYIAIIIFSLSTLVAIGVSFYLYKLRRVLLANPNSVVPEEWVKYLQDVDEHVARLSSNMDENFTRVSQESRLHTERIENMTKTYMELQEMLDEKDKEIARLKDGYDAEVFKRFIGRFARVDRALEDLISDNGESEDLSLIKRLLEDAFEGCGVERTSPNIGDDYRTVDGVSDNPKIKYTNDPSLAFQIAEVIECGYQRNTGTEEKSIIIPSKVKIYKYREET